MPFKANGFNISWYIIAFVLGITFNAGVTWVKVYQLNDAAKDIAVLQEKVRQLEKDIDQSYRIN